MDNLKEALANKKNLINFLILGILILIIPLVIGLVQKRQTITSKAAVDPIQFTGPNDRVFRLADGRAGLKLSNSQAIVDLFFTSPTEVQSGSPAPSGSQIVIPSQTPGSSAGAANSFYRVASITRFGETNGQTECVALLSGNGIGIPAGATSVVVQHELPSGTGLKTVCAQFRTVSSDWGPPLFADVVYSPTASGAPSSQPGSSSSTSPSSQPGASTQTPTLTITPSSTQLGGQVTVSWSGIDPSQAVWYIAAQILSATSTARLAAGVWTIPDCVLSGTFALSTIPSSGSCNITVPTTIPGVSSSFTPSAMIVTLGKITNSGTAQTITSSNPVPIVSQ